ncbi:hypothetical protein E4T56_gene5831 [Termitomyces sp. T112]|nr:hypothetical protein E4T56_gene5831 [Termitomyces sp. T112]
MTSALLQSINSACHFPLPVSTYAISGFVMLESFVFHVEEDIREGAVRFLVCNLKWLSHLTHDKIKNALVCVMSPPKELVNGSEIADFISDFVLPFLIAYDLEDGGLTIVRCQQRFAILPAVLQP